MLDMKATPWPTPDIIGELSPLRGCRFLRVSLQWRKLFAISVAFPAHHAHDSHPGANPDFYACMKEIGASWNLH